MEKVTVSHKITTSEILSIPFSTVEAILIAHFQCAPCAKLVVWGEPSDYGSTCNSDAGDAVFVELHVKVEREETSEFDPSLPPGIRPAA